MANPSQFYGAGEHQLTSTGTGDVQTYIPAAGIAHLVLSVETTDASFTLGGGTPGSGVGHVLPKGALPFYVPVGKGTVLKMASTAGTSSVMNISDVAA